MRRIPIKIPQNGVTTLSSNVTVSGSAVHLFSSAGGGSSINTDPNQGGKTVEWKVEGGAPSALLRRGWNRNSLPKGTKIIVTAFRARDGAARASASEISFPDGQTLSLGNPQTEAAIAAAKRGGE